MVGGRCFGTNSVTHILKSVTIKGSTIPTSRVVQRISHKFIPASSPIHWLLATPARWMRSSSIGRKWSGTKKRFIVSLQLYLSVFKSLFHSDPERTYSFYDLSVDAAKLLADLHLEEIPGFSVVKHYAPPGTEPTESNYDELAGHSN